MKTRYLEGVGVIYKLTCTKNGKVYIGKTLNFGKRINNHKNSVINGKGSLHLKNAIVKYGWDSFEFEILEKFENFDKLRNSGDLLNREEYYIERYNSTDRDIGYNLCKRSTDRTGIPHTDETKEKLRNCNLGRKHTEETKKLISKIGKGRKHSEETRRKIKVGNLGKKISEETKEKIRNYNLGKTLSEETKEKIRKSNFGKIVSEETKKKMRNKSKETIEKMRQAKLGKTRKPFSKETIEKMRQAKLGKTRKPFSKETIEN